MSRQPGRYSLVSLTDLAHLNRYTVILMCLCISRVGHAGRMLSSAICRLLCLLLWHFVQHVTATRQVQPGLDRLDTSQIQMSTDMPCISCRSCRSDAAVLCHLPVVVFMCCDILFVHCTEQVQLVSLTDLTHPNRCTDVYWYALNRAGHASPCSCLLLSAGCCAVAACTGFVQHVNTGGYRLQGLLHRSNTSKQSCWEL
jgi:hypothetical protein